MHGTQWQHHLKEDIAALEKETHDEAIKQLVSKKALYEKIGSIIDVMDKDGSIKRNLTDPDGPIMKGKKGNFDTHYNVQVACCEDNQIITYCDVSTCGNDKAQLESGLERIKQNTGQEIHTVIADTDYSTFNSFEYMDKNGICGYVPYRDMNTTFEGKPFHSSHFEYDARQDVYTCPAGHTLLQLNGQIRFKRRR